jgi:hypothetical protein
MSLLFCVNYVNQVGALWIGVWKNILVPFRASKTNGKGKPFSLYG